MRKSKAPKSQPPAALQAARGPDVNTKIPKDLSELGPLSIGHPHAGYLLNAAEMPRSPRWVLTVPSHGFGTRETVDQLQHCLNQVHDEFPGSHPVMLGSLSARFGGHLPPHKSHRTGRDADVYFFRKPGAQWSRAATEQDIDLPRTWALLRCFVTETDVEMILIVRRVQDWLEQYALSIGEPEAWIRDLFHDKKPGYKTALVRDVPGHVAHMHVRFVSAEARRNAVRVYDRLVNSGIVQLAGQAAKHEVVKGDTLSQLAERYGATVSQIQRLNGLDNTVIRVGQKLVIHKPVDLRGARDPVHVPARRLPPAPSATQLVANAGAGAKVAQVEAPVERQTTSNERQGRAKSHARASHGSKGRSAMSWSAKAPNDRPSAAERRRRRQRLKDPFTSAGGADDLS